MLTCPVLSCPVLSCPALPCPCPALPCLQEDYVRYCAAYALEHCAEDLRYFEEELPGGEKGLRERLRNVAESEFAQITYT